jgi:hypothetical protein
MVRALGVRILPSNKSSSQADMLELRQVKKPLGLLLVLICIGWIFYQIHRSLKVEIKLPSGKIFVSLKEKKQLEYFLEDLVIYECGGYTLLGNKPVTFTYILKPIFKWDLFYLWDAFSPSNIKRRRAWQTFKKYQPQLCGTNIIIWSETSPWNKNVELILLANKKEIYRVISENEKDFEAIDLKELKSKDFFAEILQSHEGLIGTVLGYGRNNAWLFWKDRSLLPKEGIFSKEIHGLFKNKKAALNFAFGWPKMTLSDILMYPTFRANPDLEETKQLKESYLITRKTICNYYEGQNFLEATIQLLCRQE